MCQNPFAGQATQLIAEARNAVPAKPVGADSNAWIEAAEACVVSRIGQLRIYGGLPKYRAPIAANELRQRLQDILRLWADGCIYAVDEELFADILQRRNS